MNHYFIAGTGTGVGKTLVTTALCHQLGARAIKPVLSGYDPNDLHNDTAQILRSCGMPVNAKNIAAISPWRFTAPLAPNMAAEKEGRGVDFDALIEFCRCPPSLTFPHKEGGNIIIESAGGIMSPLTHHHTMLDWALALGWPVILVGGTYLGAISHTLTALNTLHHAPVPVSAVIVSESETSPVTLADTVVALEKFVRGNIPVVGIARLPTNGAIWEHVPLSEFWDDERR